MATTTVVPTTETASARQETPLATREESRFLVPAVDIYETDRELMIIADLPGVEKDGLMLQVHDGVLTIEGKVSARELPNPIHSEFPVLNFYRQFRLDEELDQEKIEASLKHGVLTLRLPKVAAAQPRQVTVQAE